MHNQTRRIFAAFVVIATLAIAACDRSPEAKKLRHIQRAEEHFGQKNYREAILDFRNVLAVESENLRAIRGIGLAHFELEEYAQAFAFLSWARSLGAGDADVRLKVGSLLLAGGRVTDARNEASQVLEKDPLNVDALTLLSSAIASPDQVDPTLEILQDANDKLERPAKLLLALGSLYIRKGDFEKAGTALRDAVERDPKWADAHTALAAFHLNRRDLEQAEAELRKAASLSPLGSKARLQLVDYFLIAGHREEARKALKEMTENAPDFGPGWRRQAELALAEKRLDDAEASIDEVLKRNVEDLDARLILGRIRLARDDLDGAIRAFQRVVKAEPKSAPARHQLALAYVKKGDLAQAKSELAQATALTPDYADPVLLLAQLNLQSGATAPAIESLKELLKKQPNHVEASKVLGGAYLVNRQIELARDTFLHLRKVAPKDPKGPLLLGVSLRMLGKNDEATREFEEALRLDPSSAEALSQLVEMAIARKDTDGALKRVKAQMKLAPQSGKMEWLQANVMAVRGDLTAAEAGYLRAIELEPTLLQPYIALAQLYARKSRFDEAIAKFDAALKVRPDNPGLLTLKGVLLQVSGKDAEAVPAYEAALRINPRLGPAANNLAYIYDQTPEKRDKALELAQTAKELLPDDPRVSDTLGWILHRRGVNDRAIALISESAAKLPDNPEVQFHLGMAFRQAGKPKEAQVALERALALNASFAGADEAKKALEELR